MRDRMAELFTAQMATEVEQERINPDALDGFAVTMECIELAATLGIAETFPVGGFVAGAGDARFFDEGFKQHGAISVTCMPVISQTASDQGEDTRGEILTADPRQDEEAGIIDVLFNLNNCYPKILY